MEKNKTFVYDSVAERFGEVYDEYNIFGHIKIKWNCDPIGVGSHWYSKKETFNGQIRYILGPDIDTLKVLYGKPDQTR